MAWVSWIARQFEDFDLATAGPMALDSRSAQRLFQANLPTPTFRFKTWQGEALSPSFSDLLDHITIQHADHLLQNRSKPWLPNRDGTRPKCRRMRRRWLSWFPLVLLASFGRSMGFIGDAGMPDLEVQFD